MKKPMIFEWREHFEREHRKYFPYEIKSLTTFGESFEDNAYKHPKNPASEFGQSVNLFVDCRTSKI